jgi:hypothetical protein
MSEFKFSCPACGQNILGDTVLVGKQIACPHCNVSIIVPGVTAAPAGVSASATVPPSLTGGIVTTAQKTSGLAIASLICSATSLVTCVGWVPGIICGHLAKSRIRRNPSLKGSGLATAGLLIGYLILALEVGTVTVHIWRFSAAVKQGFADARQELAASNAIVVQTQSATVTNDDQPVASVAPGAEAANSVPVESEWTADVSTVAFPGHPAGGKIHGNDFTVRGAFVRNDNLRFNATNGISVTIIRGVDAAFEGKTYEVKPTDDSTNVPRIRTTWNEGGTAQTATFSKGYRRKLQFGQAGNRMVGAKIYLCFPDDSKSYIAGTFRIRPAPTN